MNKTHFIVLAALLSILIILVGFDLFKSTPVEAESEPVTPSVITDSHIDPCSVCGRDMLTAHGGVLLKNLTPREVRIRVRHHPDAPERIVRLDPNGFEAIDGILVGTMKLRAIGEGFDDETFCTISANTQHEMWWRTSGWEMHGTSQMHVGH